MEVNIAAVVRLRKVAMDIPFARMERAKTSDGMSHAPGPRPKLNPERYMASPAMPSHGTFRKKENAVIESATIMIEYSRRNNTNIHDKCIHVE